MIGKRKTQTKRFLAAFFVSLAMTCVFSLDSSVSVGYQNSILVLDSLYRSDPFFVKITLSQEIGNHFVVYGSYVNEMAKDSNRFQFLPSEDYFMVGATAQMGNVSLSCEHMCIHHTVSIGNPTDGLYGGYTRIWLTYSQGKNK